MKNTTRSKVYLPMAAMILTAALAIPAAAQLQQVPFKGAFQGYDLPLPPTILQSITGNGTLVGPFSSTGVSGSPGSANSAHWIAANGDSIYTTVVGFAGPSDDPDYLKVTEIHTITGGTGRFTGAQWSFIVDRTHVVAPSADGTHVTFGSFDGTITPPGAAH